MSNQTQISRDERLHGNLLPPACGKLSLIPDDLLFHKTHRIRHPDSIYAISLEKFRYWMTAVLDEMERIEGARSTQSESQVDMHGLLWRYEALLEAAQEHFETHFQILKAFIPPDTAISTSKFADKYVKENELPGARDFAVSVQAYEQMLKSVNHLKHNHAILSYVGTSGPPIVEGFFFEEVDLDGILGPSPVIHPDGAGISFIRELCRHIYYVYLGSEELLRAIDTILRERGRPTFDNFSVTRSSFQLTSGWKSLLTRMSKLPIVCFPKEANKKFPRIRISEDAFALAIRLQDRVSINWPVSIQVRFTHRIDAHHLTVKQAGI